MLDGAGVNFGTQLSDVFEPYARDVRAHPHRWMEHWDLFDASAAQRPAYDDAVIA